MMSLTVAALIVTSIVYEATGYTSKASVQFDNETNGTYCEYNGTRFETGESWTMMADCVECDCGAEFMQCNGIGYNAGVFAIDNCEMVQLDNCCYQFFHENNSSVPCSDVTCPN